MGMSVAVILKLSLSLAILYGVVIAVWYELLRSMVVRRRAIMRRRRHGNAVASGYPDAQAEHGRIGRESETAAHRAAMESELERARRHYQLARKQARTERDAAIAAANQAAEQAIERIEGRYREIDGAFIDEETERILEMLPRRPSEETP